MAVDVTDLYAGAAKHAASRGKSWHSTETGTVDQDVSSTHLQYQNLQHQKGTTLSPTSYKLTFTGGANDAVRANKVFVFERGGDLELLFANVSYTVVPPDDGQGTGTIVKRMLIADDVVQELLGELRSLAEPDISAQPNASSA